VTSGPDGQVTRNHVETWSLNVELWPRFFEGGTELDTTNKSTIKTLVLLQEWQLFVSDNVRTSVSTA